MSPACDLMCLVSYLTINQQFGREATGNFSFTAKVFAPVCSEKQGYGGTKIEIPVRKRRSERKIQESGGFLQEYAT